MAIGKITVNIRAETGTAKMVFEFDTTVVDDATKLIAKAVEIQTNLKAIADLKTDGWSAYLPLPIAGTIPANALLGASRENWGTVQVRKVGKGYASVDIPCPPNELLVTGSAVDFDVTNANLVSFLAMFESTGGVTLSNGELKSNAAGTIVSGHVGKRSARYSHK
jgi:hypothetical protein